MLDKRAQFYFSLGVVGLGAPVNICTQSTLSTFGARASAFRLSHQHAAQVCAARYFCTRVSDKFIIYAKPHAIYALRGWSARAKSARRTQTYITRLNANIWVVCFYSETPAKAV